MAEGLLSGPNSGQVLVGAGPAGVCAGVCAGPAFPRRGFRLDKAQGICRDELISSHISLVLQVSLVTGCFSASIAVPCLSWFPAHPGLGCPGSQDSFGTGAGCELANGHQPHAWALGVGNPTSHSCSHLFPASPKRVPAAGESSCPLS